VSTLNDALTAVTALLDQLDAARDDSTGAFPWHQIGPELSGIDDAEGLSVGCTWVPRDAALIVAAVNSLPRLTAALRALLALADELLEETTETARLARSYKQAEKWPGAASAEAKAWTSGNAAARLRATVASALAEEEGR
jgi:hypothetical protein